MKKSNYKRSLEKKELINNLQNEFKQIDFLNIVENIDFNIHSNYEGINRIKKFLNSYKKIYEDLENFLKNLSFDIDSTLSIINDFYIYKVDNDMSILIKEETKKRIEDYINKRKLKENLEENLKLKGKNKNEIKKI